MASASSHAPNVFAGGEIVVDYDNTKDELARIGGESNHIDAVFPHPRKDFGAELLGRHYIESHLPLANQTRHA